jgi:sulfatase modifying factor 1
VVTVSAKEPIRTWTSADGRTIDARFLELIGGKIRLENAEKKKFIFPLNGFSVSDQQYIRKTHGRAFFYQPKPFAEGEGGVIIAAAKGSVKVLIPKRDYYSKIVPKSRPVFVGESIQHGATLFTGENSDASLLFTNGCMAHLGENSKFALSAMYQKTFMGTNHKVIRLIKEASASRTQIKLEEGELVFDIRKLGKDSSFLVETKLIQAGIRGTMFKLYQGSDLSELSVLEGEVEFLDGNQSVSLKNTQKVGSGRDGLMKLANLSEQEKEEIKVGVTKAKKASSNIDINRLSNTVEGYSQKRNYLIKSINMEMIWCKPGSFVMGPHGDGSTFPEHPVIITRGFYLGKFEVTQQQYTKVMGNNPSLFKGPNRPVESVDWGNAVSFCETLSRNEEIKKGWKFSLPSEAEWEYACRAGTTTTYSWGDKINPNQANYRDSGYNQTIKVGFYQPNYWGFHDMHGNVWEWVQDLNAPYPKTTVIDPLILKSNSDARVHRGSCFTSSGPALRSSQRSALKPSHRGGNLGFRVALKKYQK